MSKDSLEERAFRWLVVETGDLYFGLRLKMEGLPYQSSLGRGWPIQFAILFGERFTNA